MSWEEVEQRIEKARIHRWKKLNLSHQHLTHVPESIGNLSHLIELNLSQNQVVSLPSNIETHIPHFGKVASKKPNFASRQSVSYDR